MQISNKYIVLEKILEEKKEDEFNVVSVQDSSTFMGKVKILPEIPVFIGNRQVTIGDKVLFAKNSPDTHEVEYEDDKVKFVALEDLLGII